VKAIAIDRGPDAGKMNKTEAAFLEYLRLWSMSTEPDRPVGTIYFEGVTLRLADNLRYTPDFLITRADTRELVFYEVKGFWRDDARAKIKMAAHTFPCVRFIAVKKQRKKDGGGWEFEEFKT